MDTDLPELIANVYRACGKPIEVEQEGEHLWVKGSPMADIGLDAFVRDIVPTLNERGWSYSVGNEPDLPGYLAIIWKQDDSLKTRRAMGKFGWWDDPIVSGDGDSPVEACFRAAWAALQEGTK